MADPAPSDEPNLDTDGLDSAGPDAAGIDTVAADADERRRSLADRAARTWTNALFRAGNWADRLDSLAPRSAGSESAEGVDPAAGLAPDALAGLTSELEDELGLDLERDVGPGRAASVWAVAKAAIGVVGAPVTVPTTLTG